MKDKINYSFDLLIVVNKIYWKWACWPNTRL